MHAGAERIPGFAILQQVAIHAFVSLLSLSIAFSLPTVASFVLYDWWPRVSASSKLLLATEIAVAAVLVLLFNAGRLAWQALHILRLHNIAALVHVRRDAWPASRGMARKSGRAKIAARDALILSVTGFHTFTEENAPFHELVGECFETRVLLLHPLSDGARERLRSLPDPEAAGALYRQEIRSSIAHLKALRDSGRHIRLKLYKRAPFWSIVVAGDLAWVRYCHDGYPLRTQPDYVFALRKDEPTQGLFPPFYRYTLNEWEDPAHPEYDFATAELVYRSADGVEMRREHLALDSAAGFIGER